MTHHTTAEIAEIRKRALEMVRDPKSSRHDLLGAAKGLLNVVEYYASLLSAPEGEVAGIIATIKGRLAAISPRPWTFDEMTVGQQPRLYADDGRILIAIIGNAEDQHTAFEQWCANGEFIATAPSMVATLLAEVARLSARVRELEGKK